MSAGKSERDQALRHVETGERVIAHQHNVIDHLRSINASTDLAEELLRQLQELHSLHRRQLARLDA